MEEIKKAVELTEEQQAVLNRLNDIIEELKRSGVMIVFDHSEYSFAAINGNNIEELQDADEVSDRAVDIEDSISWGNILFSIYEYGSYYGDLHAILK